MLDAARYDTIHPVWDLAHDTGSPIQHMRIRLLLELLPERGENKLALDAGCGAGDVTLPLLDRGFRVHGIDGSRYALERLEKRLTPSQRKRFSGEVSDFDRFHPRQPYDLILLCEVLEHMDDDAGLLRRMRQALKPDGWIVVTVPADPGLWSDGDVFSGHVRRYTRRQLEDLILSAGLVCTTFRSYGFPILWTYSRIKKRFFKMKQVEQVGTLNERGLTKFAFRQASRILRWMSRIDHWCGRYHDGVGYIVAARPAE